MSEPTYRIAQALHARRAAVGLPKYGQHLSAASPGCMIVHALEEAADQVNYLIAEVQRRKHLIETLYALAVEVIGYKCPVGFKIEQLADSLGGRAALAKYDEILGGAEDATVAPDPRDEPAISTLHKFEDGNSPEIESITTTAPTPGSLLRWVVLETGLMRYVEVHDTEDSEFDEAARLYETKRKAISPAPDPRDEALRKIADGAEEDISDLTGVERHVICKFCGDVPHDEECPHTIATSALAAQALEALAWQAEVGAKVKQCWTGERWFCEVADGEYVADTPLGALLAAMEGEK